MRQVFSSEAPPPPPMAPVPRTPGAGAKVATEFSSPAAVGRWSNVRSPGGPVSLPRRGERGCAESRRPLRWHAQHHRS